MKFNAKLFVEFELDLITEYLLFNNNNNNKI